jgi:hypothetical protein
MCTARQVIKIAEGEEVMEERKKAAEEIPRMT